VVLAFLVAVILTYPIAGVATLLAIAPVYLLLTPFVPRGLPVSFLILILTVIGLLFRRCYQPRAALFTWTVADRVAVFLLLNGLIYIPLASSWKAGVYGYHEMFRLFLIYFAVRLLRPGRGAWMTVLGLLAAIDFVVLAYGAVQPFWNYDYIMVKYGLVESLRDYAGFNTWGIQRAYSLLGSPLSLGYLGMMGVLASVGLLSQFRRSRGATLAALILLVAAAAASAMSFTRSSWMGIITGLGVGLFFGFRGRARLALLALPLALGWATAILLPAIAEIVGYYALTILSTDPAKTSMHYVALAHAAEHFAAHLLGEGLGASTFSGMAHGKGVTIWSENTFLQMGIQTGLQGLVALVVFIGAMMFAAGRLFRDEGADAATRCVGVIVLMAFPAFAMAGMSIPTILDVAAFGPLWFMAAVVVNARETSAAERGPA
jgi:hypothetical protein